MRHSAQRPSGNIVACAIIMFTCCFVFFLLLVLFIRLVQHVLFVPIVLGVIVVTAVGISIFDLSSKVRLLFDEPACSLALQDGKICSSILPDDREPDLALGYLPGQAGHEREMNSLTSINILAMHDCNSQHHKRAARHK